METLHAAMSNNHTWVRWQAIGLMEQREKLRKAKVFRKVFWVISVEIRVVGYHKHFARWIFNQLRRKPLAVF